MVGNSKLDTSTLTIPLYKSPSKQFMLAVSHYHSKFGPKFVGSSLLLEEFSQETQDQLLYDSISTHSSSLMIFPNTLSGFQYQILVHKFSIVNKDARGGIDRYAILLKLPKNISPKAIPLERIETSLKQALITSNSLDLIITYWTDFLNYSF